jgi:hypothetical protein
MKRYLVVCGLSVGNSVEVPLYRALNLVTLLVYSFFHSN